MGGLDVTISFTTVTDDVGFRNLEPAWRALTRKLDPSHFYQEFDWCWRAWECLASKSERPLRILVGSVEGRVALILPLMIGGPYLRFIGVEILEFFDVLVEPATERDEWLDAAMRATRRLGGHALLLRNLQSDSDLARFLSRHRIAGLMDDSERHHVLHLDRFPTWEAYLATLSTRTVADQRRRWRRLSEQATVSFDVLNNWPEMLDAIRWNLDRKTEWLRGRGEDTADLFGSKDYRRFLEAVSYDLHQRDMTFVGRLTADNEIIAALLGFKNNGYFVSLMFSYAPAWRKLAPGRLVMERTIQWCYQNGFTGFDFLMGDDTYKGVWANEKTGVTHYLLPITLQGHAIAAWHRWGGARVVGRTWFRLLPRFVPSQLRTKFGNRIQSNAGLIAKMRPVRGASQGDPAS